MSELSLQTLEVNGLRMQVATQGSGAMVLRCGLRSIHPGSS